MKAKKSIAVLMAVVISFTFQTTASAVSKSEIQTSVQSVIYKGFLTLTDKVISFAVGKISSFFPTPSSWSNEASTDSFMQGDETFLEEPAENACFSLGYDSRSILTDNVIGNMYVGGGITAQKKLATSIEDDLKVRTAAISDGSGRGIHVLAEIDAYGISLPDVKEIRTRLAEFAKENNIISITVAVLHQHSAVDTLGMNGDIFEMVFVNPWRINNNIQTQNGKNSEYMENLFSVCCQSIEAAVSSMKEGKLYYATADQSSYLIDKRAPYENDVNFNRFRFVPFDGSTETWLVSTEIHCVGNGAANTAITGDYPYYAEEAINEVSGANVLFFMGAQQSTTQNKNENTVENYSESMTRLESTKGFGHSLGKHIAAIEEETEVAPLINVKYKQIELPVSNNILLLAAKVGMFDSDVKKTSNGYSVSTELGYMELGTDLAFAIIPGELAPELAYGGCLNADDSWSGTDWNYPSMQEIIKSNGSDRTLKVLGLANDQVGYIIPDNNYMPILAEESGSLEIVSLGNKTASSLIESFEELIDEIN